MLLSRLCFFAEGNAAFSQSRPTQCRPRLPSQNETDNAVLKFLLCSGERDRGWGANCLSSKARHYPVTALSPRHARAGQLSINKRLEAFEWAPLEPLPGGRWQGREAETAIRPLLSQCICGQREGKDRLLLFVFVGALLQCGGFSDLHRLPCGTNQRFL